MSCSSPAGNRVRGALDPVQGLALSLSRHDDAFQPRIDADRSRTIRPRAPFGWRCDRHLRESAKSADSPGAGCLESSAAFPHPWAGSAIRGAAPRTTRPSTSPDRVAVFGLRRHDAASPPLRAHPAPRLCRLCPVRENRTPRTPAFSRTPQLPTPASSWKSTPGTKPQFSRTPRTRAPPSS